MTKIENATSNLSQDLRALRDDELDSVNGGVTGNDGGCVPWINFFEHHDPGIPLPFPIGWPGPRL